MAQALLMLHGFTHTGASWDQVREALPRGYRAIAPDIRGHGSAAQREPVNLTGVQADLAAIAPRRFTLIGYSMGGRIALHAALAPGLRERLQALVLISSSPGLADPAERAARREADARLAREIDAMTIAQIAERWATSVPVLAGQPASVRARVGEDRRRNTPEGLARALRGLGTGALPSLWERLDELTIPVELVVGERDAKFRTIAERMAAALPAAGISVAPGCGHAVHLEDPKFVVRLLTRQPRTN